MIRNQKSSQRIVFHLRGGLGNQLFQATAASYYAEKFQTLAILNDSSIIRHTDKDRQTWLRHIDINLLFGTDRIAWQNPTLSRLGRVLSASRTQNSMWDEESMKLLSGVSNTVHVSDWFQNSSYAKRVFPKYVLLEPMDVRKVVREQIEIIEESEKLGAIHVRLGDFKQTPWGVLSADWYVGALARMLEVKNLEKIDCYSDEVGEAREILKPLANRVDIRYPEENLRLQPHELLWSLSKYKSYVSSNSSLSWWASFFNQTKNPYIICNWGNQLIMKNWEKLELSVDG